MRVVFTAQAALLPHSVYCHTQSPAHFSAFLCNRAMMATEMRQPRLVELETRRRKHIQVNVVRRTP